MASARIVRLFVSAPDDVEAERLRVKSVAERLNGIFTDIVRIEVLSSQDEFSLAAKTACNLGPSECDIVIGIFWSQIGTALPPTFALMPDGEPYPSITAYELLSTIWKRQEVEGTLADAKGERLPDILVFQKQAPRAPRDETDVALLDLQWKLLKGFIERWFRTPDGRFRAGFHRFTTASDFEAQIERLLLDWLATNIMAERSGDIAPQPPAVVSASPAPARRRHGLTAIAVIAVIAAGALALAAATAVQNWRRSQTALEDATATISELVAATSESGEPNAQADNVEVMLEKARKAIDNYATKSTDPRIVELRARTYLLLSEINLDRGRIDRVSEDAAAAFAMLEPNAKAGNLEARHMRAQAERLIAATNWERGNNEEAKSHYEKGIVDLNALLNREGDTNITWRWMRSLAEVYQGLGDVLLVRLDRPTEALEAFEKSRLLRIRLIDLGHQGPAFEHDLAWITNKRGEVENRLGNDEAALKWLVEARDRLTNLKDRIWDNPRWAADLGAVYSNIGALKRKQNRFAEAAPQFAQAEDILAAVQKRDPKSLDRRSVLNWCRFVRAENAFRWAFAKNDRILMLEVREQAISIVETAASIVKQAPQRTQEQLNRVREEAFRAAIDATLRQWNGNHESAAAGFIEAADIITKDYLPMAAKMPSRDLLADDIQYLEWAGAAYARAQKKSEAQTFFKRALDMLVEYRGVLGEKIFEDFHQRIAARVEHTPPSAERKSPPGDRTPDRTDSIPPAPDNTPPSTERPPSAADTISPPQQ